MLTIIHLPAKALFQFHLFATFAPKFTDLEVSLLSLFADAADTKIFFGTASNAHDSPMTFHVLGRNNLDICIPRTTILGRNINRLLEKEIQEVLEVLVHQFSSVLGKSNDQRETQIS